MPADPPETIRLAEPKDIPELSALFIEVFAFARPEAVWRWKYFDNPNGFASVVCESDGRIVAHCGGTQVSIRDGGDRYEALQSVDFMSSATYGGGAGAGGVFARTARQFFQRFCGSDKISLVYGFPGERHRLFGERVLGYRAIEPVGELSLDAESDGESSRELSEADLRLFSEDEEFCARRTQPYLRWRYLDHPLHRYRVIEWRRFGVGPRIAALVRSEMDRTHVMELGGKVSTDSVKGLAGILRRMGRRAVFWTSLRHPVADMLREAGFAAADRDHLFECRFFNGRELPASGEFYWTLGDYDVY